MLHNRIVNAGVSTDNLWVKLIVCYSWMSIIMFLGLLLLLGASVFDQYARTVFYFHKLMSHTLWYPHYLA